MSKKRILVIDDEKDLARLIKLNLEETGLYEVSTAHDGSAGLKKAEKENPDLIILDIMMPKKSGFQVLKELRKKPGGRWQPVIVLTAKGDFDAMQKGHDLEADHYIVKPFDKEGLLRSVLTVLSITPLRED